MKLSLNVKTDLTQLLSRVLDLDTLKVANGNVAIYTKTLTPSNQLWLDANKPVENAFAKTAKITHSSLQFCP